MSVLIYRREIDGLRALAIVPVVLFHLGLDWLSGGYLGVDVFFVISGYLIASILLKEKAHGAFTLTGFWVRRARRVLPALFFVTSTCIPLAWFFLLPKEYSEFKESVGSVALFLSNHLFLDQSGYFDISAERKPLLHTWSLAIEEQFYIFFPLIILATWRLGLPFLSFALLIIILVSLGLAQWLSAEKPAAAFYLLPTRAWELGSGALLSFMLHRENRSNIGKLSGDLIGSFGLILIVFSFCFYTPQMPSPSFYTLVPVLGTCLVLIGANASNLTGRLLGLPIMVGVGLISYSLYLWHQPILAFARVQTFHSLGTSHQTALFTCSLLGAYFSWKWIERPFKDRTKVSGKVFACWLLFFMGLFIYLGIDGYKSKQTLKKLGNTEHRQNISPSIMLLGDSHASHLFPGLSKLLHGDVIDFSRAGCLPLYGVDRYDSRGKPGVCPQVVAKALDYFERADEIETLILSSMGPVYLTGAAFRGKDMARVRGMQINYALDPQIKDRWLIYERALRNTLTRLNRVGKRIIFVIDIPELGVDPLFCDTEGKTVKFLGTEFRIREPNNQQCYVSRHDYEERTRRYRELTKNIISEFPDVSIFDPTDLFCDQLVCRGIHENKALYRDADHLSEFGSEFVARALLGLLAK